MNLSLRGLRSEIEIGDQRGFPALRRFFGAYIAKERLMAMAFSLALVGFLYFLLHRTKVGASHAGRAAEQRSRGPFRVSI